MMDIFDKAVAHMRAGRSEHALPLLKKFLSTWDGDVEVAEDAAVWSIIAAGALSISFQSGGWTEYKAHAVKAAAEKFSSTAVREAAARGDVVAVAKAVLDEVDLRLFNKAVAHMKAGRSAHALPLLKKFLSTWDGDVEVAEDAAVWSIIAVGAIPMCFQSGGGWTEYKAHAVKAAAEKFSSTAVREAAASGDVVAVAKAVLDEVDG